MALRGWWYRSFINPRWTRRRPVGAGRRRPGGPVAAGWRAAAGGARRRRRVAAALAVVLLLLGGAGAAGLRVMPALRARAEAQAVLLATQAVYRAVGEASAELAGRSLIRVHSGPAGEVRYVEPDVPLVQAVAARVTAALAREAGDPGSWVLGIPLGQLLGDGPWAAWGPAIPVRVMPAGMARVDFRDVFEGAGLNQTRYALYLQVAVALVVATPFFRQPVETTCSVPVAQAVIVGEVPQGMLYFPPPGQGPAGPAPALR